MEALLSNQTNFTKIELKKIREAIVQAQKKREYCIMGSFDIDNLEALINHAFYDSFKIDLFDNDD